MMCEVHLQILKKIRFWYKKLKPEGRHPMAPTRVRLTTSTCNISVNKFSQFTQAYLVYRKIRTYL